MPGSAEEGIHEKEQQFAVILRSIGDGLIATDADGLVTLMNPVAEKLTGYSLSEAAGLPLDSIFRIVQEGSHQRVESPSERVLREGTIVGLGNHTLLIAKDGSERPIADSAAPILDSGGETRGVVLVFRDQTEERAAQRALRESEERLQLLIDGVRDYAIYMLDLEGHIVRWNAGAQRMMGYTAAESIGQPFTRLFSDEDKADGKPQRILDIARKEGRFEEEGWRIRKDGSRFWANCVLAALHGADGVQRGFAKITRDLTAQRAAEEKERELVREQAARLAAEEQAQRLRESEERYRQANEKLSALLAALDEAITMQNTDGQVVYANEVAARIFGHPSAEKMLSAPPAELGSQHAFTDEGGSPLSLEELPTYRALAGEPAQERVLGLRLLATGELRWIRLHASPIRDAAGHVQFVINRFRDITETRRQELRKNFIVQATVELGASFNYQATLATVARLAVPEMSDWCAVDIVDGDRLQRLAVEHVDPSKVSWVKEVEVRYPPDPHAATGAFNVLRTGQPEMMEEIPAELLESAAVDSEHLRLIKELQLRSYICVPLRARGQTLGVLTFVMAESNRRYNREDLMVALQLADRAAVAIDNARLLRDAQQARSAAELANRSKDEFMAILGHELRNPLAPIVTAIQLMKLRDGSLFGREREIIERQIKHLIRLVDDLLDISRITRGKIQLTKRRVVLAEIVAQAIETASPLLEERRHELKVSVPGDLRVLGDEARLSQAIANLLNNAAKYTEKQGSISVIATREGSEIVLRVSDNGIGIAPDMLPNIFDLFVQQQQTIDRSRGGLGIGLALVRSLVQLHGGSVSAFSAGLGRGTEVCIRIPALESPEGELPSPLSLHLSVQPAPSRGRVLVVDDNEDAARLLAEALAQWGYETHVAFDGPSGLQLAQKVRPTLAVLDIGLPGMNGYELAQRLRSVSGLERIHLIANTGYGQAADRERALSAGFDEHLIKPIDLQELQRVLERLTSATGGS